MRIAVICTQYGPHGGTGRVTTELFERFARDGHSVDVYCGKHEEGISYRVDCIKDLGLKTKGVFLQLEMLLRACNAVDRSKYDIVYTTGGYYHHPDIVTIHSLMKSQRRAQDSIEKSTDAIKSKNGAIKKIARKIYMPLVYELGETICYSDKAPVYIGVSEGTIDEFAHEFHGGSRKRCLVIENGVDTDQFKFSKEKRAKRRQELQFNDNDTVALFAGSDWGCKRLDIALSIVAQIPNLKLVVLGHDDQTQYKQLARELGCSERITFPGFTTDIESYYSMSDFLLFTSAYETFGLVALEAMACGCIVLSHPVNGCRDFIANGQNGFLCDFGDVDAFVRNIAAVVANGELKQSIAAEARNTAEGMSWESVYLRYLTTFESVTSLKMHGYEVE